MSLLVQCSLLGAFQSARVVVLCCPTLQHVVLCCSMLYHCTKCCAHPYVAQHSEQKSVAAESASGINSVDLVRTTFAITASGDAYITRLTACVAACCPVLQHVVLCRRRVHHQVHGLFASQALVSAAPTTTRSLWVCSHGWAESRSEAYGAEDAEHGRLDR